MIINNKTLLKTLFIFVFLQNCTAQKNKISGLNKSKDNTENRPNSNLVEKQNEEESYVDEKQKWRDIIYDENIQTVLLYESTDELSFPVIRLNSSETLTLKFDELEADITDYHYSIFKCKKDWTDSDLDEMEYISGFQDNPIESYKNSYNTYIPYIHYSLIFPNDNIQITKSGNYRIVVYPNGEPEQPILTKNFYVTENIISVTPQLKQPADMETHDYQQEIDAIVHYNNLNISNPYESIQLEITQNNFDFTTCNDLTPNYIRENTITYNREDCNIFWGNNEFHNLDLTGIRLNAEFESNRDAYQNTLTLPTDVKRTYKNHLEQPDIDGKMKIRTQSGLEQNNSIEADYIFVTFSLEFPFDPDNDIYIIGGLSQWEIKDKFKMEYHEDNKAYECRVLLKQGFYNYLYALVNSQDQVDIAAIEGSHYETQNTYLIKVYYSDPINFYDRLLFYKEYNSREIKKGGY